MVPAWTSEAGYQPGADRVARHDDYGNVLGRSFRCKRARRVERDDDVNFEGYKFCSELWKCIQLFFRRSELKK